MSHSIEALLLGILEGLTEFIPVSSTGHLLVAERYLGHRPDWFTVFIQVGAALALLPLFWTKLTGMLRNFSDARQRDYLLKLFCAFLITSAGGLVLHKMKFQLPEDIEPVGWAT